MVHVALTATVVHPELAEKSPGLLPDKTGAASVTDELPVFVKVSVFVAAVKPTVALPKSRDVGVRVPPTCVPKPVKSMASGVLAASLMTRKRPAMLPTNVGENIALIVQKLPGVSVVQLFVCEKLLVFMLTSSRYAVAEFEVLSPLI